MSLFSWFAKREKTPSRKEEDSTADLALYSGIRGNRAELHQYSEAAAFQGSPRSMSESEGTATATEKPSAWRALSRPCPKTSGRWRR
jgi:hypothetical protein